MQTRRDLPNRGYSNPNQNPLIKITHLTNQISPKLQRQPSLLPIITKNYTTKNSKPETQDQNTSSLPTEKETVTTLFGLRQLVFALPSPTAPGW